MSDKMDASVGLDTTAFRAGVTDLKNQVKAIETSFRASAAVMGEWSKSTDGLGARTTSLEDKLKLQKQALATLNEEYKKATTGENANEKAAQSLANQMYSMEKQIESTERDLEKYNAQLKLQQSGFEQFSQKMKSVSEQAKAVGKGLSDAGKTMTAGLTVPIAGIAAAAINLGDEFEAQMSRVKATSGATGKDFDALTAQAKQLGQDTAFSASEAAEGMENLASAGFETKEIMAAMPGMLDLAASSGEDLATSSDIAASTLRGFGLAADQAGHVADVLAKNAADTNAAVADTGEAMKYIAPVAQNAGWSLEQVTAAIGEMANAGIKGEQAGTTLRGALTSLMNPSKKQADAMKAIGFSAYDAQGKMKPLSQIIGELGTKTKGLTNEQRDNAIATIMGTNSLSGMQVLLKDGRGNLDTLTASLKKSDGTAKSMANTMQGNTKGAIEQMKGSLETAAITVQEKLAPSITRAANAVQELANKFAQLSPAQQDMIIKGAAIVAIVGPIVLLMGKMISGVGAIAGAISTLTGAIAVVATGAEAATPAVAGLASAIKFMTGPIGLAILAVTAAVTVFTILWNKCAGFRNFWIGLWNGIKSAAQAFGAWFSGPFVQSFQSAGNGIKSFFTGILAFFTGIWNGIQTAATAAWNAISSAVMAIITPFVAAIQGPFDTLKSGLSGILNGIKSIFTGVWTVIKNVVLGIVLVFIDLITGDFNHLHSDLSGILNNIKNAFSTIWNGIKSVVLGIVKVLVGTVGTIFNGGAAVLKTIGNGLKLFFTGLWNGIKSVAISIWNKMISGITSIFNGCVSGIKSAGNGLKSFLGNLWNGIKSVAISTWNGLKSGVISIFNGCVSGVKSAGNGLRSFLGSLWSGIKGVASSAWNGITGVIRNAWNGMVNFLRNPSAIYNAIKNAFSAAINWIKQLPSEAIQWGKDIINGIVNGIKSAAGAVGDAAKGVAQNIRKFLHHTHPDEGPLADDYTWMPDMMDSFAQGINANKYKVVTAMRSLATDMSITPTIKPAYAGGYAAPQIAVAPTIDNASLTVAVKYLAAKMDAVANKNANIALYTDDRIIAESANRGNAQIGKRYHRAQG